MARAKKKYAGRIYLGTDENGKQLWHWVGRFDTKRERDDAVARARTERPWETEAAPTEPTCGDWCDRYLARYEREYKRSSYTTAREALRRFQLAFGNRAIGSITPVEAEDWANTVPPSRVPPVVTLFNYAVQQRVIPFNPFKGIGKRGRGRADTPPPTVKQLEALLDVCDVLGDYASQMRALVTVGAYTGARPGELYELRWGDIDFAANRIHISRRLYRGTVDLPKSNKAKTIALVPPARDALLRQPTRAGELVFVSKTGKQLTASTVSQYWALVRARAGLDFDLYLATKHYGVHLLYRLGLSKRAIAAQVGWSEDAVDGLLRTYGHLDLIAPAEVDALYQTQAQMQPDPARSLSGIRPIPVVVRLEVAQELERFGRPHGGTG